MADSKDSSSRSISETVNGSHKFTIKGYSLLKGKGMGKCISSCTFPVGGYEWAVYFYPDGKNPEDNAVYVSVFIALASEGTDVRALFELTLMDQSDKGKHKVHSHFDRALESGPYTLKYKGSMWGYKRFFRRTTLEASDYLKDDCLVMKCTVGVIRTRLEGPKNYSISVSPSEMGLCFKDMLESEIGCDIVFQVGDDTFKAHKLVLAARSSVFQAQFYGLVGDSNMDKVVVKDVDPLVFKAMLFFIYTDSLPDLHEITDTDSLPDLHEITGTDSLPDLHEITGSVSICMSNIVQHLLAVADLYSLDRLKLLCESKLCEELNPDTVATTLVLAEQHGCKQLKSNCLKFATCPSNLGVVMQSDGYKHLECFPPLLSELLRTVAAVDENSSQQSSKKRCSSSVIGLDLTPEAATPEAANPIGRRLRRRV